MKKPKVSIIVPMYKSEKTIEKCLDSLLGQTIKDIEIICINDGSPDKCIEIVEKYKEKNNEIPIEIIDKKNEGVWCGRFDGIKKATGEYIAFVDSDDYVSEKYIEMLLDVAIKDDSDITVCGYQRIDMDTGHIYSCEMTGFGNTKISLEKNLEQVLCINTGLWNKLFKSEVLKKIENIEYSPRVFEDVVFLCLAYLNSKTIRFIDKPLYFYMVHSNSLMNKICCEQIEITQKSMECIRKIYEKDEIGKNRIEIIDSMAFVHLGISLMLRLSDEKDFSNIYKQNENFLTKSFPTWKKTKYLNIIYNVKNKSKNLKIAIIKKIYVLHMFKMFLAVYKFITKTFKIEIKW